MTDLEHTPDDDDVDMYEIFIVKDAARPLHTLLPSVERTARWTLRVVVAGHVPLPHFNHWTSPTSALRLSTVDSLYYDN